MSEITYTYEITSVSEEHRCMEITFTSEGRQPVLVGARLPFEGEAVDDVVKQYAPVQFWRDQERSLVIPQVGTSGTVTDALPTTSAEVTIPVDLVGGGV